ncbi:LysR substrate-binding domain-containing protein [Streptomyces sp. NPDC060028]|uniref:LysR substrate-binding domain-containing protein n=1 Tax=Streptomyces sp. NPDC060028 TaxID=3347041 RepID=UPI0036B60047
MAATGPLDADIDTLRARRHSHLHVAASQTIAEYLFPEWLMALRTHAPETAIALRSGSSADVARAVAARLGAERPAGAVLHHRDQAGGGLGRGAVVSSLAVEAEPAAGTLKSSPVAGLEPERTLRAVWPAGQTLAGPARDLYAIARRSWNNPSWNHGS